MSRAPGAVRRQRDFASLSASRDRGRSGPIRVTRVAHDRVEVGFAIGRSVGTAVVRNRLRRRLRVLMRDCLADGTLRSGRHLVSVSAAAADSTYAELGHHLRTALAQLQ